MVLSEEKQRHPTEINNRIERSGLRRGEITRTVCSLMPCQKRDKNDKNRCMVYSPHSGAKLFHCFNKSVDSAVKGGLDQLESV